MVTVQVNTVTACTFISLKMTLCWYNNCMNEKSCGCYVTLPHLTQPSI